MTQASEHEVHKLAEIAEQQEAAVKEFRKQLLEEGIVSEKGDSLGTQYNWVLLRFLRARKFNLKNSKTMIKNCLEWRRTVLGVGIDELYLRLDPFDYPERHEVFKHWPIWYHNTDKRGRPINVQALGGIDVTSLYKAISPEKFWETLILGAEASIQEVLASCSYVTGRIVNEMLIIVDLKDFGIGKFWQIKDVIRESFQITQDYFPETMGLLVAINAPHSFSAIWVAVKPVLAKETQEKVRVFGSDYVPFLLELVDADKLPKSLGGNCTCADAGGCQFSNVGPWMEGRKERREKWVKGEIPRLGLSFVEDRAGESDFERHQAKRSTCRSVFNTAHWQCE